MERIKEQFIITKEGKKKAVVIPIREYRRLMEDLRDLSIIAERKKEKEIDFEKVIKRLKLNGYLPDKG